MKKQLLNFLFILFVYNSSFSQNYIWAKAIDGTNNSLSNSIQVDVSGNVYITGYFNDTTDFDPGISTATLASNGQVDIFVAKYDNMGNYLWAINIGGSGDDIGNFVQLDAGGNVYVTGVYQATVDFDPGAGTANLVSAGASDIFMAKYDNTGNYVWAKSIGNTGADVGNGLQLDASGNVYITGYFAGTVDFDPGIGTANLVSPGIYSDVFIAKYDNTGAYFWAKNIGGPGNDIGNSLQLDASSNIYLTGTFQSTVDFDPGPGTATIASAGGISDIFIAKYDNMGNYTWAKSLGGPGDEVPYTIQLDAAANVHVTGYFSATVDFDPGAGTANLISNGNYDVFIGKYDNTGNYIWAKGFGGTGNDVGSYLQLDAAGSVYLTGTFHGNVDFDPGPVTATLNTAGSVDIFISRFDNAGNFLRASNIGGVASSGYSYSMKLDASDNMHITGRFQGYVDFDMSGNYLNLSSIGRDGIYIAKYNDVAIGIKELSMDAEKLMVYPNPNRGQFYLGGNFNKDKFSVEVVDVMGKVIMETDFDSENKMFDFNSYSKGLYFIKVYRSGELLAARKICVE